MRSSFWWMARASLLSLSKAVSPSPLEKATEKAGQCTAGLHRLVLDEDAELLAHERGWIWACDYTQGKQRTHIVLVHADGTPVAAAIACDTTSLIAPFVARSISSPASILNLLSCRMLRRTDNRGAWQSTTHTSPPSVAPSCSMVSPLMPRLALRRSAVTKSFPAPPPRHRQQRQSTCE